MKRRRRQPVQQTAAPVPKIYDEKVGEIYKTNDYGKFALLEGNRDVDPLRVKKIKASMEKVGVIPAPIIVNEDFGVIDGQGRLQACMENGYPLYYTVVPGLGIAECIAMNAANTNWKAQDYINSLAQEGLEDYVALKETIETYPELPLTIVENVLYGSEFSRDLSHEIKNRQYKVDRENFDTNMEILNFLKTLSADVNRISGRKSYFYAALTWCCRQDCVNRKRLGEITVDAAAEARRLKNAVSNTRQAL